MKKAINNVFLTYASDILADTNTGLTASEIGKYFSAKSLDCNIEIPFYKPPFVDVPNKKTAFLENLKKFNPEQQFEIINELVERLNYLDAVKDLKNKLYTQYIDFIPYGQQNLKSELVKETQHWLQGYKKSYSLYNSSLDKLNKGIY